MSNSGSLKFNDFVGGTVGGIVQVLTGQPFDILKVRAASSSVRLNPFTAASLILKEEGVLAF